MVADLLIVLLNIKLARYHNSVITALLDHLGVPILVGEGILVVVGLHAVRVGRHEGRAGLDVTLVGPDLISLNLK